MTVLGEAVLTGASDGGVRLWDLNTARVANAAMAHSAGVRVTQFKGNTVVSCSSDRSVALWDPRQKAAVAVVKVKVLLLLLPCHDLSGDSRTSQLTCNTL